MARTRNEMMAGRQGVAIDRDFFMALFYFLFVSLRCVVVAGCCPPWQRDVRYEIGNVSGGLCMYSLAEYNFV
jgi:cytochrome c biogenesis factor